MNITDIIGTVRDWMVKATQISAKPEINPRRAAFQVGMQLEELAEKLTLFVGSEPMGNFVEAMHQYGNQFKRGHYDDLVAKVLALPDAAEDFLDGDIDLLWVTAGSLAAQGADGHGAFNSVDVANWKKYPNGVVTLDANGKVVKPEGWTPPDLSSFTFLGRQQAAKDDAQLPLVS